MKLINHFLILSAIAIIHNASAMNNDITKDIAIGSIAAVAEVAINQPLIYFKNMAQQNKSISLAPSNLWRGAPGNAASLAPVTAIQVMVNNAILEQLKQHNIDISIPTKMSVAFAAGALSGLASCPSENIMLHQQNTGDGLSTAIKKILQSHNKKDMYRALLATMIRDGGFTLGFLGLRPVIKQQLEGTITNQTILTLGSGISAGLIASTATHPFDTIKTTMQSNLHDHHTTKYLNVIKTILSKDSARGLFKGLPARATRAASAITVMGYATDQLSALLKNK